MTLTLIDIDLFPAKIYLEYILHQKPPSSWCCETADITAEPSITFQYLKQQREVISACAFCFCVAAVQVCWRIKGWGAGAVTSSACAACALLSAAPGEPWLAQSAAARPPAHMQHCVTKPPPLRLFSDFPTGVLCLQRFSCISCQIFTPQQC